MAELREYKPTVRDRLRYGIQDTLMNFGADPYEAGKWAGKIAGGNNAGAAGMGLLDFTPAAIIPDAQEAKLAYDQGRYLDAAASGAGAALGLVPFAGPIAKNAPDFLRETSGAIKIPGTFEEMTPEQKLWTYMQGPWADYPDINIAEKGYLQSAENFNNATGFAADIENMTKNPYQYSVEDAPNNPFYVPDPPTGFEDTVDIDFESLLDEPVEISGEGILGQIVNEVSGPPTATADNYKDVLASMSPEQIMEWYYATPFGDIPGSYGQPNLEKTFLTDKEIYTSLNDYFKGKDMGGNPQNFSYNSYPTLSSPMKGPKSYNTFQDAVADGNYEKAIEMLSPEQTAELMYMKPYSQINATYSVAEDKQYLLDALSEPNSNVKGYFETYLSGKSYEGAPFEKAGSDALTSQIRQIVGMGEAAKPVEEEIMSLLRAGRGAEVTDEMMKEANQALLTQMYDLPMDAASRAGRAVGMGAPLDERGMPQTLFHAYNTKADPRGQFDEFRNNPYMPPGRHNATFIAENPRFANSWGQGQAGSEYDYSQSVEIPKYGIKPVTMIGGEDFDPYNVTHVQRALEQAQKDGTRQNMEDVIKEITQNRAEWPVVENNERFTSALEAAGFRSAPVSEDNMSRYLTKTLPERTALYEHVAKTGYGQPPSLNRMVFRPQNLRSIYARFDPRLKHLKHLSAGIGGLAVADALEPDMANELAEEYLQLLVEQPENNT